MRALTGFACAIAFATFSACSYAAPQESGVSEAPAQTGGDTSAPDVLAPAGTYKIDRSHSSIVWRIDHLGLAKYTARFNSFEVTLDIDPADPESATLSVSIDPNSVDTAYPYTDRKDFDAEVATSETLLNSGVHGSIDFVSTDIIITSPTTAEIAGELTLLGVTQPVTIDATYNGSLEAHPFTQRPMLGFSGTTTIKRSDFGMDFLADQLGDEVEVVLEMEFSTNPVEE